MASILRRAVRTEDRGVVAHCWTAMRNHNRSSVVSSRYHMPWWCSTSGLGCVSGGQWGLALGWVCHSCIGPTVLGAPQLETVGKNLENDPSSRRPDSPIQSQHAQMPGMYGLCRFEACNPIGPCTHLIPLWILCFIWYDAETSTSSITVQTPTVVYARVLRRSAIRFISTRIRLGYSRTYAIRKTAR